jgi:hypothetical protein
VHNLMPGGDARRIARLADLAEETGAPLVATNDVHYHSAHRRDAQELLHDRRAQLSALLVHGEVVGHRGTDDTTGEAAEAPLTVVAGSDICAMDPTLTVEPGSAYPGDTVSVVGQGFPAGVPVVGADVGGQRGAQPARPARTRGGCRGTGCGGSCRRAETGPPPAHASRAGCRTA